MRKLITCPDRPDMGTIIPFQTRGLPQTSEAMTYQSQPMWGIICESHQR